MKSAHTLIIGLVICVVAVGLSDFTVAFGSEPDWNENRIVYKSMSTSPQGRECQFQKRRIAEDPNKMYDNYTGIEFDVCVYTAKGYQYSFYERKYRYVIAPHHEPQAEKGIAVAKTGESEMTPVTNIGVNGPEWVIHLGAEREEFLLVINSSNYIGLSIIYLPNLPENLERDLATNTYKRTTGFQLLNIIDGKENPLHGYGKSRNGKWLGMMDAGRMLVYDMDSRTTRTVRKYNYRSPSSWPDPSGNISISNDGLYVSYNGFNVPFEVILLKEPCWVATPSNIEPTCQVINLKILADQHSKPPGEVQYLRSYSRLQISEDGGHVTYYDGEKWASIYAHNMRPLSDMRYLALGDSFASGEGDMSNSNKTYYIPGTDVVGSYPSVPQEMCHISNRSYPFLLAAKMGLSAGGAMKSVACSGAVASDVLTFDTNNQDRILADTYMGQERVGGGGPRLSGVPNAAALKDEARQTILPGRVQQIEHVQKTKPEAVTIMMGGNDLGFGSVMMGCANLWNWGRLDDDCEQTTSTGGVKMVRAIQSMYPQWVHMYKNIKKNTASGKVYVIGYPHFLATDNICSEMAALYTRTERKSINQMIDYANATMKNAAHDAGVWYIDITHALEGKELCGKSSGVTGVNDLVYQAIMSEYMRYKESADDNIERYGLLGRVYNMSPIFSQAYQLNRTGELAAGMALNPSTTIGKTFQQLSHPNQVGHQAIYDHIANGLGANLLESDMCNSTVFCPSLDSNGATTSVNGVPDPGEYVEGISMDSTGQVYVNGEGAISIGGKLDSAIYKGAGEVYELTEAFLTRYGIDTYKPIQLSLHSDPLLLGTFERKGEVFVLRSTLPNAVPVGMHTLHVSATTTDGRELDIVKYVVVLGPRGDIDDDGILDTEDRCAFGAPNSQDDDHDMIADNCDMYVAPSDSSNSAGRVPKPAPVVQAFQTFLADADSTDQSQPRWRQPALTERNPLPDLMASPKKSSKESSPAWADWLWMIAGATILFFAAYVLRRKYS